MNLSKSDKRALQLLVTHYNFRVGDVDGLTSLFNNAFGSFLRSSSGPAVRAKRAKALEETFLSSFPTQTLRSGRTNKELFLDNVERARVSELTVGSVNWPEYPTPQKPRRIYGRGTKEKALGLLNRLTDVKGQ